MGWASRRGRVPSAKASGTGSSAKRGVLPVVGQLGVAGALGAFAALGAVGALAGCAAPGAPPPRPIAEPPLTFRGMPAPPDAKLDPPGQPAESAFVDGAPDWVGSVPPGSEEQRDGAHMRRIKERGRVIVGVDQSQYLLSYRDVKEGDLRGFEVDLAREIAADIFGNPGQVDFRFVESAARAESLRSGEVDMVIRTMSITPERTELVDFSTPYLTSAVRVLATRDRGIGGADDLAGKTVCIVDGTNLLNLVRARMPESEVLRTRSWSDCLMALQQFQADAIVGDDAVLAGMVAQDPLTQVFPDKLANQLYAIGVAKGHDDVVRQVNFTVERIRDNGTWDRIYDQWLGNSITESWLPDPMYRDDA